MLEPLSDKAKEILLKNLVLAVTKDISKLSVRAYQFIHVCSGFIAHYNIKGFIAEYGTANNLADAIFRNRQMNQWKNFSPGEENYEYYHQKAEIYEILCSEIADFRKQGNIFDNLNDKEYIFTITTTGTGKDPQSALYNARKGKIFSTSGMNISYYTTHEGIKQEINQDQ